MGAKQGELTLQFLSLRRFRPSAGFGFLRFPFRFPPLPSLVARPCFRFPAPPALFPGAGFRLPRVGFRLMTAQHFLV